MLRRLADLIDNTLLGGAEDSGDESAEHARRLATAALLVETARADFTVEDAELERLDREIEKRAQNCERLQAKLANEKFVGRAPAEVVEKERAKLADARSALEALESQRRELSALAG